MRKFQYDETIITQDSTPFVIAEIGVNYYDIAKKHDLTLLDAIKKMIMEAKNAGANAVKFQTYKAGKLASKYSPAYWDLKSEPTTSQYELFKKFDKLSDEDWSSVAEYCSKQSIMFLSTPFDLYSVDLLDELMPIFKIASADITNKPLLEHIASKNKPVLLSTGASNIAEIYNAKKIIELKSQRDLSLLHCVLSYPTLNQDANLSMIQYLQKTFPDNIIGYSDHTAPDEHMMILTYSYLKGAKIIEKHFTLDKTLPGNDHYHAMDPNDLKTFLANIAIIDQTNGQYVREVLPNEVESRKYARRSIIINNDMEINDIITMDKIDFKRPGTGISPMYLERILGRKLNKNKKEDEILHWKDIS